MIEREKLQERLADIGYPMDDDTLDRCLDAVNALAAALAEIVETWDTVYRAIMEALPPSLDALQELAALAVEPAARAAIPRKPPRRIGAENTAGARSRPPRVARSSCRKIYNH